MDEAEDGIEVGAPLPKVAAVAPVEGLAVSITWSDGRSEVIDLSPSLLAYKVFKPLRTDRALFERVAVEEFGSGIYWPGEMDLGSYTLERLAESQRPMSAADFRGWLDRHGFTLDAGAAVLGLSRRQVAYYTSGEKPVDRTVALACRGYDSVVGAAAE